MFNLGLTALMCLSTAIGAVYLQHPLHNHHNKVHEWSKEMDLPPDDVYWQQDLPDNKEMYQWVENDVVEKQKTESDGLLRLPGGCELTVIQYQRLQEFRKGVNYVQNCYCQEGGVYCRLRKNGDHVYIT